MDEKLLEQRKETIYRLICDEHYGAMKIKEMAIVLQLPKERRPELLEVLNALIEEGKIEVTKKGKYRKRTEIIETGVFTGHQKGFGFVTVEGMEDDIFIPADDVNGAMHEDVVQVRITDASHEHGRRREGVIIKIVEHGVKQLVGYYENSKNYGFVIPDNPKIQKDIFVSKELSMGAVTGHKVVCEITKYGKKGKKPEGRVVEILGHANDPGVDILSIVKAYDLPVEFSNKIMKQVERVAQPVSEADMAGRMDIRDWQTVTIDGEDAKDLDDAITLTKEDGIYILGVHIADVTNYVQEHSALDEEAKKRGTSVYLVDRVIPMLPHGLSNGICSLNQGEDRLALSCIMEIDEKGKVLSHQIAETVVNVDRRMSYTAVNAILQQDEQLQKDYRDFVPMFTLMKELADILRTRRMKRGSIDFDFPESKIILDKMGRPIEVKPYERNAATKIIEDFMLLANETVAEEFYWRELPFVYRTHDIPDEEKIRSLSAFINNFGYHVRIAGDDVHPKELQKLLTSIEGSPYEALISRLTLRSMKQAKYTVDCTGHFGLAAKYYCHFTSPIRRYPDLQIHRIIKETLRGRMSEERKAHYHKILPDVSMHASKRERLAEEAERETDKLKKAEYMESRIGEEFEGVISGVTQYGMYVELPNTIEGLVRMADMRDDYYQYYEESYELVGEIKNKHYKLGQTVKIQVKDVDRITRTIDFILVEDGNGTGRQETDSK